MTRAKGTTTPFGMTPFDVSDCVLARCSAAGFSADLRRAADPRLALIPLAGICQIGS